jgi:hypothetical protein
LAGLIFLSGCKNWESKDEVFHLRGAYNNEFYKRHFKDFQLTTVAHWAHGRISDVLISQPADLAEADRAFYSKSEWFLKNPAQTEPHQTYVGPEFARLAWRAVHVIDWTHQLHEQLYDIMTDPRIPSSEKKIWIDRAVDFYLSEPSVAFSPAPFEEVIMKRVGLTGQPWFKSFRNHWPKTTDLFWAFHWWHPVVYEAQLLYPDLARQQEAVLKIDDLFLNQVIPNPPNRMLLSREVMPQFSQLSPEAANIFDNLHMFHGIIYDILASPDVKDKRREIYKMIDRMTVKPGDRAMAKNFPTPNPNLDPLVYSEEMWKGGGEMGRIMGHSMHHHMKG